MNSEKTYFENLDGLRFFAFLIVFISHAAIFLGYNNNSNFFQNIKEYILINGDTGVSFFFVLSGFLITYLLFKEKDKTGRISLKKFYIKRILRIWPVYFATLIIGFFFLPFIARLIIGNSEFIFPLNPSLSVLPQYLLFLANFNRAFMGGSSVPTGVLWSISVEEQFYLIWPWVIAFLPRKYLLKFLSTIILISCVYRYVYAFSPNIIAYSTLSVMSDLAIGSLLAFFVYTKNLRVENFKLKIKETSKKVIASIYVLLLILIFGRHYIANASSNHPIFYSLSIALLPILLASIFAFIIFEQNELSKSFIKIGRIKFLGFFGRISYGLYAYHMVAVAIVLLSALTLGVNLKYSSTLQWFTFAGLSLILTLGVATFSYYVIEKQFLKRKPID